MTKKYHKLSREILGLIGIAAGISLILFLVLRLTASGIGAVVLERLSRDSSKKFLIAQIMASAALVVGMLNAFS